MESSLTLRFRARAHTHSRARSVSALLGSVLFCSARLCARAGGRGPGMDTESKVSVDVPMKASKDAAQAFQEIADRKLDHALFQLNPDTEVLEVVETGNKTPDQVS